MNPETYAVWVAWMPWVLLAVWLGLGLTTALALVQRGATQEAAMAALVAWPFLLPALQRPGPEVVVQGPYAVRIDRTVRGVRTALEDAGADTPAALADLAGVTRALRTADARLVRVEALIAATAEDAVEGVEAERAALHTVRSETEADVEAVLVALAQLRLQVGRLALLGESAPVHRQLRELTARVAALGELASP